MTTDGGAQAGNIWTDDEWLTALNILAGHAELREARMTAYADILAHVRGLAAQVAALTAERDGLLTDLIHCAQTNHQAHHGDHSGTWLSCDRGSCPGLRRAVSRARGDTTPPAGAQEGHDNHD